MIVFICDTDNCSNKGLAVEFMGEPESAYCTGCNTILQPITITEPTE